MKLIIACLLFSFLSTGCATITQGSSQTLTLNTDPTGAKCELKRGGSVVAVVNPTPGSVSVTKSKTDIDYHCVKDGHDPAVGMISSDFQGWTFGNILLGGVIGLGVDAASGALNEYQLPPPIVLKKQGI